MLPYVMAFNRPARESALAELATAFGEPGGDAVELVHALGLRFGLPARLADLDLEEDRLAAMGEQAAGIRRLAGNNPRPLEPGDCTAILRAAWHGDPSLLGEPAAA
jgi:alcohol dehydrogenase